MLRKACIHKQSVLKQQDVNLNTVKLLKHLLYLPVCKL